MKASEVIWLFLRKLRLGGLLLQVHPKSHLRNLGWFRSFESKKSIDLFGNPIPWWCYSANAFVAERIKPDMRVLEFGAGASTLWLARHASSVVSMENDHAWFSHLVSGVPSNVTLLYREKPADILGADLSATGLEKFHLLIIDPLANRINCARAGIPFLEDDGVVIWDNTDGPDWPEIKALMAGHGFKEISFSGIAAQEVAHSRTTVFYRPKNIFLI